MKTYHLKRIQKLPISIEEAWTFFSSPVNLKKITPENMGFIITSEHREDEKIYPGQIITYTLTPILGIRISWMTEITHAKELHYFVDEQRFGPYALWHHTHIFKTIPGGIEMTDSIHYAIPYGLIGRLAHFIFVKKQVLKIFDYRHAKLIALFGEHK